MPPAAPPPAAGPAAAAWLCVMDRLVLTPAGALSAAALFCRVTRGAACAYVIGCVGARSQLAAARLSRHSSGVASGLTDSLLNTAQPTSQLTCLWQRLLC